MTAVPVRAPSEEHLRDGASLLLRPVDSGDRELIAIAYERLSGTTRFDVVEVAPAQPHRVAQELACSSSVCGSATS